MKPLFSQHPAAHRVRLLLLDVDGVLTDGKLYFGADGFATKAFHVRDGLGLAMLRKAGVLTGIVSGRSEVFVERRATELGMRFVRLGIEDKAAAVSAIVSEANLAPDDVAFMGDDVNDIPAFAMVGVSIAVADAHPRALAAASFVTAAVGGAGAVREVADAILSATRGPG